jgi:hypothetical protein
MKALMRKRIGILSGALTSILIILSWVAIFAGIFEGSCPAMVQSTFARALQCHILGAMHAG